MARIEHDSGIGTGFIYETAGQSALVLTNEHVVSGLTNVTVTVEEEKYNGRVLGSDAEQDIAVLSICCGGFRKLSFSKEDHRLGMEVVAIGHALGLDGDPTVTRGIVSALRWDGAYGVDVVQTDAPINEGNSGGPLLSIDGFVVGMNTFKYLGAESVGFAIDSIVLRMRAPALASPKEMVFENRTYVKEAGSLSGVGTPEVWNWHTFARGEAFIVEVAFPDGLDDSTFAVRHSLADGLQPETESVSVGRNGCSHSVWDEDTWQTQDEVDVSMGRIASLRVVVSDSWRVYSGDMLKCEHNWVFGRAGWVGLQFMVPFENLAVWVAKE